MASTLAIPSLSPSNLRERSVLAADYAAGTSPVVESTQGFSVGDILYVGRIFSGGLRENGCKRRS